MSDTASSKWCRSCGVAEVSLTSERDREFRHCEICCWIALCVRVDRGSQEQPRQRLELVPKMIWLCNDCFERSNELWQRKTK